jgi:hypothetical protein
MLWVGNFYWQICGGRAGWPDCSEAEKSSDHAQFAGFYAAK